MINFIYRQKTRLSFRVMTGLVIAAFLLAMPGPSYAQMAAGLPVPGTMVTLTPTFAPPLIKGIVIHPENPLQFDFLVDPGNVDFKDETRQDKTRQDKTRQDKTEEYSKLIKYFLAALTVPEKDLWVNLSPYEENRIISDNFAKTEMGRDLLSQDYLLKQLTASLMYPEKELGQEFWEKVYKEARERFGTTEIPVNTFNKVWIIPDRASVYEKGNTVFLVDSHLKVMLEEDYLALEHNSFNEEIGTDQLAREDVQDTNSLASGVVREVILPAIEKEVNEGQNFALLRQINNSLILATWYKTAFKESLLGKIYADQNKTDGVNQRDVQDNEKIYQQYLEAFQKGVYNYIKEDYDPATQEIIPRKYSSGGFTTRQEDDPATPQDESRLRGRITELNPEAPQDAAAIGAAIDAASPSIEKVAVKLDEAGAAGQEGSSDQAALGLQRESADMPEGVKKLTIYGDATIDDWKGAILRGNRWHEGGGFKDLLGAHRVLVLGDTNHGLLGIQRALVEHLVELKEAGVTHLGLEIASDLKVSDTDKIAQTTWIPHRFKELVGLAEKIGLKVVFIDMPESQREDSWSEGKTNFERGVYMGNFVSEFIRDNPDAVMTVVTGYAHIQDNEQIPAQFDRNHVQYSLAALVSEGQQDENTLGVEFTLFPLPLTQAITEITERDRRYGYVDLRGLPFESQGVTAIVHFPRPKPIAPTARPVGPEAALGGAITGLDVRDNFVALSAVAEGVMTGSVHIDFRDRVSSNVRDWDASNQHKIIEFVKQLEGITKGQKFYLAAVLINYANNTGEHSLNGSIVDIGFVPEGQFFEITTVDTAHYAYDPNADYDSAKRHWEVSLRTLQEQFGFEDIFIENLSEVPEISIRPNPLRPLSVMRMIFLILTAIKHPERIAIGYEYFSPTSLSVFKGKPGESVRIARLEFDDFTLNHLEQSMMEAADAAWKLNSSLSGLRVIFFDETLMPTSRFAISKKRTVKAVRDSLVEAEGKANFGLVNDIKEAIFQARKGLSFLNSDQSAELLEKLDEAIIKTEGALKKVGQYADKNSDFSKRRFKDHKSAGTYLAQARYLLLKLKEARSRINASLRVAAPASQPVLEPLEITALSEVHLSESVIPPVRIGFERVRYFTGGITQGRLGSLFTEGIDLTDFGRTEQVWNMYKTDFDQYMFHERDGSLGYVVVVDIPGEIVDRAESMGGDSKFDLWKKVKTLISLEVISSRSGALRLRPEFIVGAIDQRTGQWFPNIRQLTPAGAETGSAGPKADSAAVGKNELEAVRSGVENAGIAKAENVGGIDLNPANLNLQIKRDGSGVPLPLPFQDIPNINVNGFIPVIINITPIPNLPLLLGINPDQGQQQLSRVQ